jgi:hypothetical protein
VGESKNISLKQYNFCLYSSLHFSTWSPLFATHSIRRRKKEVFGCLTVYPWQAFCNLLTAVFDISMGSQGPILELYHEGGTTANDIRLAEMLRDQLSQLLERNAEERWAKVLQSCMKMTVRSLPSTLLTSQGHWTSSCWSILCIVLMWYLQIITSLAHSKDTPIGRDCIIWR